MAAQRWRNDLRLDRIPEPASGRRASRGFVWFVGAGPGDPELLTLRGARLLRTADVVLHDALVHPAILDEVTGQRIDVGKRCGRHSMRQEEISALIVDLALRGRRVVRLKGGDSSVLGRVGEEALVLAERDIAFEIVPGVSSATAVTSAAGIPLTHRGLADSFVVATARRRDDGRDFSIPTYAASTTVVLMMASRTVSDWREQLLRSGYPAELPVALISAGCTELARVVETSVAEVEEDLEQAGLQTPILAVVGWVVTLRERLAGGLVRLAPAERKSRGVFWGGAEHACSEGIPASTVSSGPSGMQVGTPRRPWPSIERSQGKDGACFR
ncbi:MAG: uroporphyrinogen-III C-methyltransferase [Deltaproteobacteria bacterium]|nr:uroporphyrinogen-III C-methyltransferase [Deltaproteobacteria bacterium]